MSKLFVKPAIDDSIVRDPARGGQPLPADGAEVPNNSYWQRRINDGSVVRSTPPKKTTKQGDK